MPDPTKLDQEDDSLDLLINATSEPPAAPARKVELDLDDAPFLQAEEKSLPAPSHEAAVPEDPDAEAEKARRKKRLKIIIAAACAVIVAAGVAVWWFFFRVPPETPAALEPEIIVVPSAPADAANNEVVRTFEPFVIPVKDAAGNVSFLICKFSSIARDGKINQEIDNQRTALRDAIYFYLRSKDSGFLQDARNAQAIKADLLSIFNDYLTQGKLDDILFESYLSR